MKYTDTPEYFRAEIPFNPDIDKEIFSQEIQKAINSYYPLWENKNVTVQAALNNFGNHVLLVMYGPKKRNEINSFDGFQISSLIKAVYKNITGDSIGEMGYGWGYKEDGSAYSYDELYQRGPEED